MSKVVFAVAQQDPDVAANGWDPPVMAIMWDASDTSIDDIFAMASVERIEPPDIPSNPGLWIWEGTIQGHWDRREYLQSVEFDGTWRRPSAYELAEISEGRWPEKDDESPGALGCNYKRGKPGTGSTACPGKRSDLAKCMSCKDFNLNAW